MIEKYVERIEELRNELGYEAEDLIVSLCDFDKGYISDAITEISDNNIDIYYDDLFEWAKKHTHEIDESLKEFGGCEDIVKAIQMGQFWENEQNIYEYLEDGLKIWALNYLRVNDIDLKEEKIDELLDEVTDDLNEFEDIIALIEEKKEEEQC